MIVVVPKETKKFERRVALTPDMVKKYNDLGCQVKIEKNAGLESGFLDEQYSAAGAEIVTEKIYEDAQMVLCVNVPDELDQIPNGACLIGMLKPFEQKENLANFNKKKIQAFSMELLPRITRAQSMDVLSSQMNLAGYRAVMDGAFEFGHAFPLMMTAAGTVPAAKVLILGVGVAGLQAIATAKRLGAIVSAYDVRPSVKEQVQSLGATFIEVDFNESGDGTGGYAKEMSDAYKNAQEERLMAVIATQDVVITTAQIPGKKAPTLITKEMVETMKPGSVIVDLAVETGGNCVLSQKGKVVTYKNIKIVGHENVPSRVAYNASQLYSKNIYTFIKTLFDKETLIPHYDDEIIKATLLTRDGETVHPQFAQINVLSENKGE
ncbi:MAG: NAD(P) transhydrogenase subunit alpha part 1 [Holosporales bacterium]